MNGGGGWWVVMVLDKLPRRCMLAPPRMLPAQARTGKPKDRGKRALASRVVSQNHEVLPVLPAPWGRTPTHTHTHTLLPFFDIGGTPLPPSRTKIMIEGVEGPLGLWWVWTYLWGFQ